MSHSDGPSGQDRGEISQSGAVCHPSYNFKPRWAIQFVGEIKLTISWSWILSMMINSAMGNPLSLCRSEQFTLDVESVSYKFPEIVFITAAVRSTLRFSHYVRICLFVLHLFSSFPAGCLLSRARWSESAVGILLHTPICGTVWDILHLNRIRNRSELKGPYFLIFLY
jgi:hypothetical protein